MKTERWWTTADLARFMNISPATVRRRAGSGQWPCQRVGKLYRFTDEDVQEIRSLSTVDTDYHHDSDRIAQALRQIA